MNQGFARTVYLSLFLLLHWTNARADEAGEADALADRAIQALSRIQGLSASHTLSIVLAPDEPIIEAAESERTIFHKFNQWKLDRKHSRFLFDINELRMEGKDLKYERFIYAWDGQIFTGFNFSQATVVVDGKPMNLAYFKSPATLFGDAILGGDENLTDVLRNSNRKSLVDSETLEARFSWELDPSQAPTHAVRVTLAPEHGDLPSRIEVIETRTKCKIIEIVTTQFARVDGRDWIPSKGSVTHFHCEPVTDDSANIPRVFDEDAPATANALSTSGLPQSQSPANERSSPTVKPTFRSVPLGVGKMWIDVDHKTCRINPDFEASDFVLDNMKDATVIDMREGGP